MEPEGALTPDSIRLAGITYREPSGCCKITSVPKAAKAGFCSITGTFLPTFEYKSLFDEPEDSGASCGVS